MKVCIAEKPSVAREIAKVLGAVHKQEGYLEGRGYCVTWAIGHLCRLKEPEDYDSRWKSWNIKSLPIFPDTFSIKPLPGKAQRKQLKVIKKLLKNADEIIGCCDAGQEGELIQRWIIEYAKVKKPMKRLWISSLTEESIRKGFANLYDASQFDLLFKAGRSRAIGDWLLGINATRLFTKKYSDFKSGVLSLGRVQTPTLSMIVTRFHEIQHFVPEPYWELKTDYRQATFSYIKGKFGQEKKGQSILNAIRSKVLTITSIQTKQGKESPPLLYDLTSIQMESNKKFFLSADNTLKSLQKLYEKKLISYPRVDTHYLTNDIYPTILPILKSLEPFKAIIAPLLQKPILKSRRIFNNLKVTDHHAIIPTGKLPKTLSNEEHQLFELICKRFVAAFYPDCIFSKSTVLAKIGQYDFKATGKQILDPGWRVVSGQDNFSKKKDKEENPTLPLFEKGESGPHHPQLLKKITKPPRPYTEASLLYGMETAGKQVEDAELRQLMKENGIGRPATRASIIETLLSRKYIKRQQKNLIPTEKGIELIGNIKNPTLKSAELTGMWEKKLRAIETGTQKDVDFINDMKQFISELVQDVALDKVSITSRSKKSRADHSRAIKRNGKPIAKRKEDRKFDGIEDRSIRASRKPDKKYVKNANFEEIKIGTCPACGGEVIEENIYHCSNKECQFNIQKQFCSKRITEKQVHELILNGKTGLIKGFKSEEQDSKPFDAFLVLREAHGKWQVFFDFPKSSKRETFGKCPKCRKGQIVAGKRAWGCSAWKPQDGSCDFRISFVQAEVRLTVEHLQSLLQGRMTTPIYDYQRENCQNIALRLNSQYKVEQVKTSYRELS